MVMASALKVRGHGLSPIKDPVSKELHVVCMIPAK